MNDTQWRARISAGFCLVLVEAAGLQMERRTEIDGLRAVAVLPIVLYHAGFSQLKGGFVGVDIFFVISGFLITSIIAGQIKGRSFSIFSFYESRARRIIPALLFMMIVVLIFGYWTLAPRFFKELSESAASTAVFSSNFYFWQKIDYFSSAAEYWPLIHTWSLGVEEQFYIVHPLIMILVLRMRSELHQKLVMMLLLLGSFAICIVGSYKWPAATFNLMPTRFWELGVGAALAMGFVRAPEAKWAREALAGAGAALIAGGLIFYDELIPFPGWWVLLPVAGTALIIATGGATVVGRILSTPPMVFTGLISYSLYLWHWPILAFMRHAYGSVDLPAATIAICLVAMVVMAVISWRWIERPFRNRSFLSRAQVLGGASIAIVSLAAGGIAVASGGGLPGRMSERELRIAESIGDFRGDEKCWGRLAKDGYCELGVAGAPPTVLVWGDSHAGAFIPAFDRVLEETGQSGVIAPMGGCPPFLDIQINVEDVQRREAGAKCRAYSQDVRDWLRRRDNSIRHVILLARWNANALGGGAEGEAAPPIRLSMLDPSSRATQPEVFDHGLRSTLKELTARGIKVTILDDVPEIGWNVPMATVFRMRLGVPPPPAPTIDDVRLRSQVANRILTAAARDYSVRFVTLNDILCRPTCVTELNGLSIYADDDHVSSRGARDYVSRLLIERRVTELP